MCIPSVHYPLCIVHTGCICSTQSDFVQSRDCAAHSQNPEITFQSLLRSLTSEQDRRGAAWCHLNCASPILSDQTFHALGVRHMIQAYT